MMRYRLVPRQFLVLSHSQWVCICLTDGKTADFCSSFECVGISFFCADFTRILLRRFYTEHSSRKRIDNPFQAYFIFQAFYIEVYQQAKLFV